MLDNDAKRQCSVVATLAEACDDLLRLARQPSNCSQEHDAGNHYYNGLVGPMGIYGFELDTEEKLRTRLQKLVDRRKADPEGFAASLLPAVVAVREDKGPKSLGSLESRVTVRWDGRAMGSIKSGRGIANFARGWKVWKPLSVNKRFDLFVELKGQEKK